MEKTDDSIKEIIQRAKEGNQIAFSNLVDTFWNDVYGFQMLRTKNENDAEDITIRTFSKAFDKIDTYDENYEFKTWLITISKNLHVDLLRKRKRSLMNEMESRADEVKKVLDEKDIPYRVREVPDLGLLQIFAEDPNEIPIEINYYD